jgi:hypothetical protein
MENKDNHINLEENTVPALEIRKNQKCITNGKLYTIMDILRVFRRKQTGQVYCKIASLYCEEDQTNIQIAVHWDEQFKVDENNYIIID